MKRLELIFTALLVPLDLGAVILATIIATSLRAALDILPLTDNRPVGIGFAFLIWFFPLLVLFMSINRLYILFELRHRVLQLFRIISASAAAAMVLFMAVLVGRTPFITLRFTTWSDWAYGTSLLTIFYLWVGTVVLVTTFRWIYRSLFQALIRQGIGCKRVLLVGNTEVTRTLLQAIERDKGLGYQCIGVVGTQLNSNGDMPIIGDFPELSRLVSQVKPDLIITADPDLASEKVLQIIDIAGEYHADFSFAPNLFEMLATNVVVSSIGGIPLLDLRRTPLDGWGKILKRTTDIIVSSILLVILSPIFLIVSILVKLQDGGPVYFVDTRVSVGHPFSIYKFRSMIKNAKDMEQHLRKEANERDDGPLFKMKNDPRITPLGHFLRKSRIDELPQLFNVLQGSMSLIGPRPHYQYEIAQYKKHHKKVLAIKPGLSGLAQLAGSSDLTFEEEVRLDTYYIENWSLIKDLELLLKTPFIVLFKDRSGV